MSCPGCSSRQHELHLTLNCCWQQEFHPSDLLTWIKKQKLHETLKLRWKILREREFWSEINYRAISCLDMFLWKKKQWIVEWILFYHIFSACFTFKSVVLKVCFWKCLRQNTTNEEKAATCTSLHFLYLQQEKYSQSPVVWYSYFGE